MTPTNPAAEVPRPRRRAAQATVPGGSRLPVSPPSTGGRGGKTSPPSSFAPSVTPAMSVTAPCEAAAGIESPAGAGRRRAAGAVPAGSTGRTLTAEDCTRLYSRNGFVAHLQSPDYSGTSQVLCYLAPSWPDGWLGLSDNTERERAASMPPCRRCLSALEVRARGGKRVREATTPRKPRTAKSAAATASRMREPGLMILTGSPPLLRDASDESALFMLRRELWDLSLIARFTIEGEPVSKARARFTNRGSKTQAYTPGKTHQAEQVIGWKFRQAAPGHQLDPEASYGVVALFFCGTRQRRDVDNMLKLVLDGLNEVAWPDDYQVTEVSAKKTLTLPEHARTEVAVYRIGTVQRFTHKCEYEPCGREFSIFQSTSERRYCSVDCANAARRQSLLCQVTCEGCGSVFTGSARRRYCSTDCRYVNGRVAVTCTRCEAEFTKQKCHVRTKNYCSGQCQEADWREHNHKRACGTCETCGGPTSKKTYRHCNACRLAGTSVTGKPQAVAS